jgi:4-amino-4-deoxy-L-arabinose transferase-like glycosyltransferase
MPAGGASTPTRDDRLFLWVLGGTVLLKLAVSAAVPLTNDEAYYYEHAIRPALGYRDHPPMVAWFLHPFLLLGKSEWIVRLPAILSSAIVGAGIFSLLREHDAARARAVAVLYLVSPLHILFIPYTTDTPLSLFSFLSGLFLYRAVREERSLWYVLSGVFLGGAFLSKYLAVFLGIAYALYFLSARTDRRRLWGGALLALSAAPFVAQNIYWNYTHSWANVLFNLLNRNVGAGFELRNVALHAVTQIYLITPPLLYILHRERKGMAERVTGSPLRLFAALFLVPAAVFAALSIVKSIGVHWTVSFYPFLYLSLFAASGTDRIAGAIRGMALFTAAHIAVLAVLLALPLSAFRHTAYYGELVFLLEGRQVAEALKPFGGEYLSSSTSYAQAARLSYYTGTHFFVFGPGSHNGRADDLWTDFRTLDGRKILIFSKNPLDVRTFAPFFDSVESRALPASGARFHFLLGKGFRYGPYRDIVLRKVLRDFYAIPQVLPTGRDFFRERYFGLSASRFPAGP